MTKLSKSDLQEIRERYETEKRLDADIKHPGWLSQHDRGALLAHIADDEKYGIADKFSKGCGGALGTVMGALSGWALFIWLFRPAIADAAAWVAAHFRIVP